LTTPKKLSDLIIRITCLLLACSPASALAQAHAAPITATSSDNSWISEYHRDHALVGKIWSTATAQFVDEVTLRDALEQHDILLLGEKHDNPDHHRLRLYLLQPLLTQSTVSMVALEMMTSTQQPALDQPEILTTASAEALQAHLQWDAQGWPWPVYEPLLLAIIQADVPMRAANLDRSEVLAIYRGDAAASSTSGSPQPLNQSQLDQLYTDIDISHCGMLPESQFPNMVRVQQARDQRMADSLAQPLESTAQAAGKRVLIAGNYHIRHDLGVSNYLPNDAPRALAVAFLEVDADRPYATDYLPQVLPKAAYDYIWFTPAVRIDDYCADMQR
jgi:uncharacterized iron-regulated protein